MINEDFYLKMLKSKNATSIWYRGTAINYIPMVKWHRSRPWFDSFKLLTAS